MLTLYRRHVASCPENGKPRGTPAQEKNKCACPIWIQGSWHGTAYRQSLDVNAWGKAEKLKRKIEDGQEPQPPKNISVDEAVSAYLTYCASRQLADRTLSKYKTLAARFQDFSSLHGLRDLCEWTQEQADAFCAGWRGRRITLSKTLEFARVMCRFWHDRGWVQRNWFKAIKPPPVKDNPRLPFSNEEIQRILSKAKDDRELAFLLTLRHTGLRIGDGALLRSSQVCDDRIYLYTTKAGTPVSVVIPPNLVSLLKALPAPGGYFFLRGQSLHPHTTSDSWRKRFKAICKSVGVSPAHPHRMRHSLAADLLSQGASVEDVAAILGNSPAIVAKHYSQWIKSRQDRLDSIVAATWKPKLVRVK